MPQSTLESRQDRYLDVALSLFIENGFDGTSTDMIVAEAGGSKATLYQYFPAKDALIDGLIDRIRNSGTAPGLDPALFDAPLEEGLTHIGTAVANGAWSPEALLVMRLALGEFHRFPDLAGTLWDAGPAVSYANFARYLEQKQERGEVIDCDRQLAAEHFLAGLVGHRQLKAAMGRQDPPRPAERDRMVAEAVATFVARYGAASTPEAGGR